MARSYRRVDQAEQYMLTAKGILDEVDTTSTASAWFAVGYLKGLVEEALGCLAQPASEAGVEAYTTGVDAMMAHAAQELPFEA